MAEDERSKDSNPANPPVITRSGNDSNEEKKYRLNQKQFVVEKITLIVLAIYTAIAGYQAMKMRTATKAASESARAAESAATTAATQLELNERPWVTVAITFEEPPHAHSAGPSLTFNSDGTASLNAFVVVKNIGHSIAKDISIRPQMYPPRFDRILTEPTEKQKAWCDKVRAENPAEGFLPSVFPGEEVTENFTFGMNREDIEAVKGSEMFAKMLAIIPIVYGCATYRSNMSKDIYQTPFLYQMDPVPIVAGTIPASKLAIFRLFRGKEAN
jgi:hypothetical protein